MQTILVQSSSFFCFFFRLRQNLKVHLIKVHKWRPQDAAADRVNFKLNLERSLKPDNERKTKPRRRIDVFECPMQGCLSEVKRPRQHLRQTHKITDKDRIDRKMKKSKRLLQKQMKVMRVRTQTAALPALLLW